MSGPAPWSRSFVVADPASGAVSPDAAIRLYQTGPKQFALQSTVRYVGARTGLEGKVDDAVIADVREVGPATLPVTDLASVPQPLRWLVAQYGVHTPAALVHDRLIGPRPDLPGLTDAYADRYFRFMLRDVGVRLLRRWLMWAAVALRTRWKAGGARSVSVAVWAVASLAGIVLAVTAVADGNAPLLVLTSVAPFVFAALWWRQYGAGLVAAAAAPWVLPPTIFGAAGFYVYAALEWLAGRFVEREATPVEPLRYESF